MRKICEMFFVAVLMASTSVYAWTTNDINNVLVELPDGAVHQFEMLPMRDGTKLATHYFLPPDYLSNSYPVVMLRSAYNYWPDYGRYADDVVDQSDTNNYVYKNTNGYVYIIQNLRGDGESESGAGFEPRLSDNEINDSYDSVEAISTNTWCNGRVGMYGGSGHGMAAYMGWFSGHSNLVVCAPGNTGPNLYEHWGFENGVRRWVYGWLSNRGADTSEWPKPTLGDYYTHARWQGVLSSNVPANPSILIHDSDVWHNFFLDATFEVFDAMTPANRGYLVMGAGTHQGDVGLDFPNPAGTTTKMYLPSFLEILDGATITNEYYLQYYVMGDARRANAIGNFWRETTDWPPPALKTPYYLHADGSLSETAPVSATNLLSYSYHPTNPVPSRGGNYSYGFDTNYISGSLNQLDPRLTNRTDILRFETAPFAEPTEITGQLEAQLYVSTDVEDTTFMVKLIDIYPAEGTNEEYHAIMRESATMGRYWGGLTNPAPMVSGTVYRLDIDMSTISLLIETNHRLGVHITSSSDPAFEVHPNTYSQVNSYASSPTAHNKIYLNTNYPSRILLPLYTTNAPTAVVSTDTVVVAEGGTATFDVMMSGPAIDNVTLTVSRVSGDADLSVSSGSTLVFMTNNWSATQTVTLAAAQDADAANGSATFEVNGDGVVSASLVANEADDDVGILTTVSSLTVDEGSNATFGVWLNRQPAAAMTVTVSRISGDTNLAVSSGGSLVFSTSNWDTQQTVTLAADEDDDDVEGSAVFRCSSPGAVSADVTATENENDMPVVFSGKLAAWGFDTISSEIIYATNAYFMATGLVNNSSAGVLSHNRPSKQVPLSDAVGSRDHDEATLAATIANTNYFKWTLQNQPGYRLTVTSIFIRTENASPLNAALFSDVSGISTDEVLATTGSGLDTATADVSGDARFQDINGTIEFQLHGYGADSAYDYLIIGNSFNNDGLDDIAIYGYVSSVSGDVTVELETASLNLPEGSTNSYNVRLTGDPGAAVTVVTARVSGDADITITSGSSLTFSSANWSTWQPVTLSAAEDADYAAGSAIIRSTLDGTAFNEELTATEIENDNTVEYSVSSLSVNEGGTSNLQIRLKSDPLTNVSVSVALAAGDADISVSSGSPAAFNSSTWSNWQTVTFAAAQDVDMTNGPTLFSFTATGIEPSWFRVQEIDDDGPAPTNSFVGPPRKNWRLTALDATASAGGAALRTELMNDSNGTVGGTNALWLAVQVPAIADPAMLTFQGDVLMSGAAQYSYDSTDGQNGTWAPAPLEIYQPNTGADRLQKLDCPVSGPRWYRLELTNDAGGSFNLSSVALYQLDPDGWNDYWVIGAASIQEFSVRNMTFKGLVFTNYGFDPVIFNCALAGSTAAGVLSRMDNDLERHPYARYIAVAGGGNNISANRPYPGGVTTLSNDLRSTLQMIVNSNKIPVLTRLSFRSYNTAPVVDTDSDPSSETNGSGPYVEYVYDPLIAEFCPQFYDSVNGKGKIDGYGHFFTNQTEISSDGVHPNSAGEYSWNVLWAVDGGAVVYGTNQSSPIVIQTDAGSLSLAEGGSTGLQVRLSGIPDATATVSVYRLSGDSDISVTSGSSLTFTTNNWDTWQTATVTAAHDADYTDDTATIRCTGTGLIDKDIPVTVTDDELNPAYIVPFSESFEAGPTNAGGLGSLDGQHGWAATGATVQGTTYYAGTQACSLASGGMTHTFIDAQTNVTVTFYAQPFIGQTNGAPAADDAAVFWFNTNGNVIAYSGAVAQVSSDPLSVMGWRKIEVALDYGAGQWDLTVDDTNVFSDLAFYSAQSAFARLHIEQAETNETFVDSIMISPIGSISPTDTDADGMPNDWELTHSGTTTGFMPYADSDSDGSFNLHEYISGTDPTNATSQFEISDFESQATGAGYIISWSSLSGRVYGISWTTNLISDFGALTSGIPALPPQNVYTDETHSAEESGYYRIDVRLIE